MKRRRQGEVYKSRERQMIRNAFNYFKKSMSVSAAVDETCKALGCSKTIVYAVRKSQRLTSPRRQMPKRSGLQKNTRTTTYNENVQLIIRRKVHNFFLNNTPPTLNKIFAVVNSDSDLPTFSKLTLYRLLKDIGFAYEKVGNKTVLNERDDIIRWRHNYLRQIKQFRLDGRNIVYTDESWVNVGHFVSKAWTDTTMKSSRQAFIEGCSTGLTPSTGRGQRFAIIHAMNEKGFVPGAKFTKLCKGNTADAHDEICAENFEEWFLNQLLPNLPPRTIIVLDNASYHSRKLERIPATNWKKNDILQWLIGKGVHTAEGMLKLDLLHMVAQVKYKYNDYYIDNEAEKKGHYILRLPPYHCTLNPIEMVWAQLKHFIRTNNATFKIRDMTPLIDEAFNNISPENLRNYVEHIKKGIQSYILVCFS